MQGTPITLQLPARRLCGEEEITAPTYYRDRAENIADSISLKEGMKIVDVGSGLCWLSLALLKLAKKEQVEITVVNVDRDRAALTQAGQIHDLAGMTEGAVFCTADFDDDSHLKQVMKEFTDGRGFDLMVSLSSMQYCNGGELFFGSDDGIQAGVTWLGRLSRLLLAETAEVIFTGGNRRIPGLFFGILRCSFESDGSVDQVTKTAYATQGDTEILKEAGRKFKSAIEIQLSPMLAAPVEPPVAWPEFPCRGEWKDGSEQLMDNLHEEWQDVKASDPKFQTSFLRFKHDVRQRGSAKERLMQELERNVQQESDLAHGDARRDFLHLYSMDFCLRLKLRQAGPFARDGSRR